MWIELLVSLAVSWLIVAYLRERRLRRGYEKILARMLATPLRRSTLDLGLRAVDDLLHGSPPGKIHYPINCYRSQGSNDR